MNLNLDLKLNLGMFEFANVKCVKCFVFVLFVSFLFCLFCFCFVCFVFCLLIEIEFGFEIEFWKV